MRGLAREPNASNPETSHERMPELRNPTPRAAHHLLTMPRQTNCDQLPERAEIGRSVERARELKAEASHSPLERVKSAGRRFGDGQLSLAAGPRRRCVEEGVAMQVTVLDELYVQRLAHRRVV